MLEGRLSPAVHFRFFLGAMHWGPGALDQEIDQGAWCAHAWVRFRVDNMRWGPGALDKKIDQGAWCAHAWA